MSDEFKPEIQPRTNSGKAELRIQGGTRYFLEELLLTCEPNQLHGEAFWGRDVGSEVID